MIKKIPTTAITIYLKDIMDGFYSLLKNKPAIEEFEEAFGGFIGSKYVLLVNSGTTAFYLILRALRNFSHKKEVVLPAYTVPTLTLPILEAGLKPVLCDISRKTFNMDFVSLSKVVSDRTLCIVPIHMFGFPCELSSILELSREKNIFVFEDAAQAIGAWVNEKRVGTIGDAGCFSFCRGKVFSTYSGGAIVSDSKELADAMRKERDNLPKNNTIFRFSIPFKMALLAYAVRPEIYGLFYPFIVPFKSKGIHRHFKPRKYLEFQAAVGLSLLKRLPKEIQKRYENGIILYNALKDNENILLPQIIPETKPAFNHLPVVFKDDSLRKKIQQKLWHSGIDTARMYIKPIHHFYDLGYSKIVDPFPNATYVGQELITLPTHPFMDRQALERIIEAFKEIK
jgi:dTDP-4-amino-4,6-dideoxygalactose transaminase